MPANHLGDVWPATLPTQWPAPPDWMTVSALGEIESCPRRWSLSSAAYPELWRGAGYPPKLHAASLAGIVVHLAVETVTRALVRAGCNSIRDPAAVHTMKELGGYTKIMNDCVDRGLRRFADNPRAQRGLEFATRSLRSQIPEMRTQAQGLLGRLQLSKGSGSSTPTSMPRTRAPLRQGVYPELELRVQRIGWRGKADVVSVAETAAEIVDFKTGAPDKAHEFQLRVYALLWARDAELNPRALPVHKLTIAYRTEDVDVDPPASEVALDELEREVIARKQAAISAVAAQPPQAKPSEETCRYCTVRQLCGDYWQPATQQRLAEAAAENPYMDLEILLVARHGPSSWDGVVERSRGPVTGARVLLRTTSPLSALRVGDRLRALDVRVSTLNEDGDEPTIATMSAASELFHVK